MGSRYLCPDPVNEKEINKPLLKNLKLEGKSEVKSPQVKNESLIGRLQAVSLAAAMGLCSSRKF